MTEKSFPFQPGAMLHDAIVGALRSKQTTFNHWCRENDISSANMRNTTFGMSRGPIAQKRLDRLIADAGEDIVKTLYLSRLKSHTESIKRIA